MRGDEFQRPCFWRSPLTKARNRHCQWHKHRPFKVTPSTVLHFNWRCHQSVTHHLPPPYRGGETDAGERRLSEDICVCTCQTGECTPFGSGCNLRIPTLSVFAQIFSFINICSPGDCFQDLHLYYLEITSVTLSRWVCFYWSFTRYFSFFFFFLLFFYDKVKLVTQGSSQRNHLS